MPYSDPEERRAYERERYNSDSVLRAAQNERQKQWYAAHKKEHKLTGKAYRSTEAGKAKRRAHYLATAEHRTAWKRANPRTTEMRRAERARAKAKDPLHERRKHLRAKYRMDPADYERMFAEQNGVCAICAKPPNKKYLDVDHSHETGAVRGLLCRKCNTAVGYIEHLERVQFETALDYLKRSR